MSCLKRCPRLIKTNVVISSEGIRSASLEILAQLQAANLFLIPQEGGEERFRYHHLFQELLLYRLKAENTEEQLDALHRAAGD